MLACSLRLRVWFQANFLTGIAILFVSENLFGVHGIINFADIPCGKNVSVNPLDFRFKDSCSNILTRIINGQPAQPEEFPWIVSLRYKWDEHFCGGFIINRRYIVTAAHCFNKEAAGSVKQEYLEAAVGTNDLESEDPPMKFGFEHVHIHPNYRSRDASSDIALIRLDSDIQWSDAIKPACIADKDVRPEGSMGIVAGWGATEEGSQITPSEMNKAKVPIIRNSQCKEWYARSSINWSPKDSQICAGFCEGGPDSCKGDSGGPLMVQLESSRSESSAQTIIVGIVSTGKGCGRRRLPGVYTRISRFIDWIQANVQE